MIHIIYWVLIIWLFAICSKINNKQERQIQHFQSRCKHDWYKVLNANSEQVWHCPNCLLQSENSPFKPSMVPTTKTKE